MNKQCPSCGSEMTHKKGISKAGKPYELFKCVGCEAIEWVRSSPQTQQNAPRQTMNAKVEIDQGERIVAGLTKIYNTLLEIKNLLITKDIDSNVFDENGSIKQ